MPQHACDIFIPCPSGNKKTNGQGIKNPFGFFIGYVFFIYLRVYKGIKAWMHHFVSCCAQGVPPTMHRSWRKSTFQPK
jgi:hypothetical protein